MSLIISVDGILVLTDIYPPQKGRDIYLFADGYTNQSGGMKSRRYMSVRFIKLLQNIRELSLIDQMRRLVGELTG